jgi:hypothetical protein
MNECNKCRAPLPSGAFVCSYCGQPTSLAATSAEDEQQMVRETMQAARNLASSGATDEQFTMLWRTVPLPRTPVGLAHACSEALMGISGARRKVDEWTDEALPSEKLLLSRADVCLATLRLHPGYESQCASLNALLEAKTRLVHPPIYKNKFVVSMSAMVAAFLFFSGIIWYASSCNDQIAETVSGEYHRNGETLTVSRNSISVGDRSLSYKMSAASTDNNMQIVVESGIRTICEGSIILNGASLNVAISGTEERCDGFNGRWDRGPAPNDTSSSALAPSELLGVYRLQGESESRGRLTITPTGIQSSNVACAASLSWTSVSAAVGTDGTWTFNVTPAQEVGTGVVTGGSLTRMPTGEILVGIRTPARADCYISSMEGSFVRE